ncbi:MAG: flagellar basal-body rod protein FlgF [Gammaproteobacteria bacterium]|nr:flagellar basal-body rod protein FlgF [Gammaproteobacteria bacterium]
MLSSLYSGLSGLLAFSKGLDTLSNNISNMNTPGFKSSELTFRDLFYRFSGGQDNKEQMGQGVDASGSSINYQQGELRDTGNELDIAIDGAGFFVLRKDGQTFYTRAGQFEFDDEGFLIERSSKGRVAALQDGQLQDISITDRRTIAPQPTAKISFSNILAYGSSGSTPAAHTISDVAVVDGAGSTHKLKIIFADNGSVAVGDISLHSWKVEVRDENDVKIAEGEIRYNGSGTPAAGFNTMEFSYAPTGVTPTTVTLDFGAADSISGSRSLSGASSDLKVSKQDGFAVGSATEISFNESGALQVKYSNGETKTYDSLALAQFRNLQGLTERGSGLFANESNQEVILDNPSNNGMGKTQAKRIELSNVELTEQFTDMVVIQRGYQASSQVVSVTNEMIQQLMEMRGHR